MKIGIDASRAFGEQRTGTENYSFEMIRRILALSEAKNDEFVLYVRNIPDNEIFKGIDNVKVVKIALPYLWTQAGLAFRTWLDQLDVLWIPAHTLPILRRPGLKTVVTIHGIEYEWLPAYESILQRWYLPLSTKYAVNQADKIIAVSEFTKSQLIKRLKANDYKINVVHEGVTLADPNKKLERFGKAAKEILGRYGLMRQRYVIFIGTIQPRKNLERLIEAFAFISRRCSGLKLVIVGKPGWNYEKVISAPHKWGIEKNVIFTGYVIDTDREVLLRNGLAYVQPSITEGFGLPILEAWYAGIPVVCSNGGALAELVGLSGDGNREGGKAAEVFDPADVREMGEKILKVVTDKSLRNNLIQKGDARLKNFDWNKAAIETYNILQFKA